VARGGSRPGAGRPRKPVEQHLAEGTYRASRHRHLLAVPLPPTRPPAASERRRRLLLTGGGHWRFNRDQLNLARDSPERYLSDEREQSPEAVAAAVAAWQAWDAEHGLAWRLQNECPRDDDLPRLARERGLDSLSDAEVLQAVADAVSAWNPDLPAPPGWDELDKPNPNQNAPQPAQPVWPARVACAHCGSKANLLPGSLSAALSARALATLRRRLAQLHDEHATPLALADTNGHFPCPTCTHDQYLAQAAS